MKLEYELTQRHKAKMVTLASLLGHLRFKIYYKDSQYLTLGRFSMSCLSIIKGLRNTRFEEDWNLSIGDFVEADRSSAIMVGAEHGSDCSSRFTLNASPPLKSFLNSGTRTFGAATTKGPIEIADGVILSANSIILSGVSVGSMTTVGAGCIVTKSVGPGLVVGGVPARKIGETTVVASVFESWRKEVDLPELDDYPEVLVVKLDDVSGLHTFDGWRLLGYEVRHQFFRIHQNPRLAAYVSQLDKQSKIAWAWNPFK